MVAVHVEAYPLVLAAGHPLPALGHLGLRPLEDGQHDDSLAGGHARRANRLHGLRVVAAERPQRHGVGRLVAHFDTGDACAAAVAARDHLERLERLLHAPLAPVPGAFRPLPAAGGRVAALPARAAVEVQHNLQAALLRPIHGPVDELEGWPYVRLVLRRPEHDPVAKGQADCVEPAGADGLEVGLCDVLLPVKPDDLLGAPPLPEQGAEAPLAVHGLC
mmetsp:Transcript_68692/g.180119  ORF Transcript_68692/g.180119 Transcript_68692/m.180119 type:complete len:219 (+) Transcript_68692:540-1196(+)